MGCEDRIGSDSEYIIVEKKSLINNEWEYKCTDYKTHGRSIIGYFYLTTSKNFKVGDTIEFKQKQSR